MSSGLTVVAICRSLGALHCFPRSRGRRNAVTACQQGSAKPAKNSLSADNVLSWPSPSPFNLSPPSTDGVGCELGGESKR